MPRYIRVAVTLPRIINVLPSICSSDYERVLFSVSFYLAFFGALRVGELVSQSKEKLGGLRHDDVLLANNSIRIRRSKTDVFGFKE